jgi:hypothetical protein
MSTHPEQAGEWLVLEVSHAALVARGIFRKHPIAHAVHVGTQEEAQLFAAQQHPKPGFTFIACNFWPVGGHSQKGENHG